MQANTIDEVIEILEEIINSTKEEQNPLGYFAALYQRVTIEVKNKMNTNYFDDDERMERLDVLFANRYLQAYFDRKNQGGVTSSWKTTFSHATNDQLIVLQHLLLGMNAHINLDLGIAAVEISEAQELDNLQNDFNRINELLSSLVHEVQGSLNKVWPILLWLLKQLNGADSLMIDFSMKLARDGAWKFATELITLDPRQREAEINQRDQAISKVANMITKHPFLVRQLFRIVRSTELGSIKDKIESLQYMK